MQLGFARGARWNPPVGIEHELPALRERAATAARAARRNLFRGCKPRGQATQYFKYSKNRTLALWSGSIHLPPQPFLPWRLEYTLKTKSSPSEAATGRPLDGLSTAPNFIRRVHVAVAHVDRPQPQRRGVTFLKPRALIGMPGWSKAVQLQRPWTGPERNRSLFSASHVVKAAFTGRESSPEQAGGPLGWWVVGT